MPLSRPPYIKHLLQERERLRTNMFSSISHDLKTPLASIMASLSSLQSMKDTLRQDQKDILLQTALDEACRLDGFITHILEMSRLESGHVTYKQNWTTLFEMMSNAYSRMHVKLHGRILSMDNKLLQSREVYTDTMMAEKVLLIILDNIVKHTKPNTSIDIWTTHHEAGLQLHIRDYGQGMLPHQLKKAFDKYTRFEKQDSQVAGTGLGLAIAHTIMCAQGGNISASNHPDGGAVFTLEFPKWRYFTQVD